VDFFISYSPVDERWATWVAWELERAGYTTMLQAWDFVPGTNFIDFMDRGVSRSVAVIAILSSNYIRSTYGRLEWQAAMRRSPGDPGSRLITVRIEDFPLEGLLATITFVDLVPVEDPETARILLLSRIRQAMNGRAKPAAEPAYPRPAGTVAGFVPATPGRGYRPASRRETEPPRPVGQPVHLLQIAGPRFDRDPATMPPRLQAKRVFAEIEAGLDRLVLAGAAAPDMLLIAGDMTRHGGLREFDVALEFVVSLRTALGLNPRQVVVVPGTRDVNAAACRAYFATCEADEISPDPPYWPKWRHYLSFLRELYADADPPGFSEERPWDLIAVDGLRLAVAAVNSTMAESHEDHYGSVGEEQARWFARELAAEAGEGWCRVGLINHHPRDGGEFRDAAHVHDLIEPHLDLFVSGRRGPAGGEGAVRLGRLITVTPPPDVTIETRDL
jgi:hypothetical protein